MKPPCILALGAVMMSLAAVGSAPGAEQEKKIGKRVIVPKVVSVRHFFSRKLPPDLMEQLRALGYVEE